MTPSLHAEALNHLLAQTWEHNRFYRSIWRQAEPVPRKVLSWEEFLRYPLITRAELSADQHAHPPWGTNISCPLDRLKRFHHSSGTTRRPLWWADTEESWEWVIRGSQESFAVSGILPSDRILVLAPRGSASGPSIMQEGAARLGAACLTLSPADAATWVSLISNWSPTVIVGKPSRLTRWREDLKHTGIQWPIPSLRLLVQTGEWISPADRIELERDWGAPCLNRYGLTEGGSVAAACEALPEQLHVVPDAFIIECVDVSTGRPLNFGEEGELVLTNLGRTAQPIIRYRTGDLVRWDFRAECRCGRRNSVMLSDIRRSG